MPVRAMEDDAGRASPEAAIAAALGSRSVVLVGMMGAGKSSIGKRLAARPIQRITHQRMADGCQMNPDLMRTAGTETYLKCCSALTA